MRSELQDHPLQEILAELRSFPRIRLVLSLAATVLGFLALAGHDAVSLAVLGYRLPFRRITYGAFLGYAFANSLPLSVVTGAAVRYRLYSQWGLARTEAARVITLNTVTYVVGLLTSAGLAFAVQPVLVPGFLHLPLRTVRHLLQRFRQGGEDAVKPTYGGPAAATDDAAPNWRERALTLRRQHRTWGAPLVRVVLQEQYPEPSCPAARSRSMSSNGCEIRPALHVQNRLLKRFESTEPLTVPLRCPV